MERFYFDHNATTPIAEDLLERLVPLLREEYGNASSIHQDGQRARGRVDAARRGVAGLLNVPAKDVVFTSGGTEADNLAILGAVRAWERERKHVVTSAIEHPAVLAACDALEREGVAVTRVAPDGDGVVHAAAVCAAITADTVLVSVMHVNNELGTIQPVAEIARVAHDAGALMHSDGVQAAGRIPVDVAALGVDLYAVSAHKMYAPKGAGALYVRRGVRLSPLLHGGRHENGLRAGTENVAGAVALGWACEAAADGFGSEMERVAALRDRLEALVLDAVPQVEIIGQRGPRAPGTTNLNIRGAGGEAMVIALDLRGFAVSSGSACSSGAVEPSHVLTAVGLTKQQARESIRVSLGRTNNLEQVERLADAIAAASAQLRRLSPVYASHA